MSAAIRNRLLALGVLWGLYLTAAPAFIMVDPLRPDGFLVAAVMCALLSGAAVSCSAPSLEHS